MAFDAQLFYVIVYVVWGGGMLLVDISHRIVNYCISARQYGRCCSLGIEKGGGRETLLSKILAIVCISVGLVMVALDNISVEGVWKPRKNFQFFGGDGDKGSWWWVSLAPLGVALAGFSLSMFAASHISLGWSWTPTVGQKHDHELKTDGVYRFARHPMYSSVLPVPLIALFLLRDWFITIAWVIFLIWPVHRFRLEERVMVGLFGQTYLDFAAKTGPFIWFVGKGLHDYPDGVLLGPEAPAVNGGGESSALISEAALVDDDDGGDGA